MSPLIPTSRRPDVTFCPDGRIDITARIAKALALKSGDVVNVAIANGELLLYVQTRADKSIGNHEGTVRPTKNGKQQSNNFRTWSKALCQQISKIVYGCCGRKTRLPAGRPTSIGHYGTAIPLITRNPL